ncbi:MAG TPA: NUDIX hydrolase [Solirubrobacterales bacterium]|nr:NUDIX hydrolase [Solirubrobacterales bacterium]
MHSHKLPAMQLLGSQTTYEGFVANVAVKRYRRAGSTEVERQVIEHPGSVAILAHDDEVFYLVRQPREAVEEDGLLEIPAGTLDVDGETELECAKRELAEEGGLAAEQWSLLKAIYPSPGFVSERATIFEATGLSEAVGDPDEDEEIEIVRWPLADLDAAIAAVQEATTLVALLTLRSWLRG